MLLLYNIAPSWATSAAMNSNRAWRTKHTDFGRRSSAAHVNQLGMLIDISHALAIKPLGCY
jgi:microsomal dipeptidase-like Zn-dependent dipeptidase